MSELHEQMADVLALAYRRVDWQKMTSMKRTAVDIFSDRLRAASHEKDFLAATERLCRLMGISSISPETTDLDAIMARNDEAMTALRENTIYIALLSKEKAKGTRNTAAEAPEKSKQNKLEMS